MTGSARATGRWAIGILLAALAVRLVLWSVSPPSNANDDHLGPIGYYATNLARPAPDACWQCYQPPLYYAVSAALLRGAYRISGDYRTAWRSVQLLGVLLSVAQLALVWRILSLAGSDAPGPRLGALAVLAFLPREIYTAVFVSNDGLLIFCVTLSVVLYLEALRRGWRGIRGAHLAALLSGVAAAAWTKQHGLVAALLPVSLVLWERRACLANAAGPAWRLRRPARLALLCLGLLFVGGDELIRLATTGQLLLSNQHFFDWPKVQPPGSVEAISFFDLRLGSLLFEPTRAPATVDSFWTELFAKLWFDYDPKFMTGTPAAHAVAAAAYGVGFAVSLVWGLGLLVALRRWRAAPERLALVALQLAYLAVPLLQTLRFPYYSSMKAVFALPAVSISALFLSFGFDWMWRRRSTRIAACALVLGLGLVVTAQAVLTTQEIEQALYTSWKGRKLWAPPEDWRP